MTPAEVSTLLSKEYLAAYTGGVYGYRRGLTFSAWDMSKLDPLYSAVSELAKSLVTLTESELKKVRMAVISTTHFTYNEYADLGDFMTQLRYQNLSKISGKLLDQVNLKIKDLVLTSDNDTEDYPNATGVSIWLPTEANIFQARYDQLQFSLATGWNKFTVMLAAKSLKEY